MKQFKIALPEGIEPVGDHKDRCPTCGNSVRMWWHPISIGMVKALVKMHKAVLMKGINDIKTSKLPGDMALTFNERGNFTKLRFHALVAKVRVDGKHMSNRWLITRKGYSFLFGHKVPARVLTWLNEVVDHSEEETTIGEVLRGDLFFENIETVQSEIHKLPFKWDR